MDGSDRQSLVMVGNGMTGFRLCQRLAACRATLGPLRVTVFGEEPRPAYDRIRLTELLGGSSEEELRLEPLSWYADHGIELRLGERIVAVDRDECVVRAASGAEVPFDRLVLATGSRPFVPPIPGADLSGVFVYRTVDDLVAIKEFAAGVTRAAVVGGGLLGLEAAEGLMRLGLEVHILEASLGLMPRQLDETGGRLLRETIEGLGVHVHTGSRTSSIEEAGAERVLHLESGEHVVADMVVLAAGVRPNAELARTAGLELAPSGGVVIDDHLQTSDPRIFAVGECATHRGVTYGLAAPGYRMIDVLVDNLVGGSSVFLGSDRSARLKLLGVSVAALGRYEEAADTQVHAHFAGGVYRKLVLRDGRIVGALAVGEWLDLDRVRDALENPRRFSFWDLRRFRSTGSLWLKSESSPVYEWPADALVCGCLGVRRGALTEAELAGCTTAEELSASTGAGSVCGSCRPLLVELVRREHVDSMPPSRLGPLSSRRGRTSAPPSADEAPTSGRVSQPVEEPVTVRSYGRARLPSLSDAGPLSLRHPILARASGHAERDADPPAATTAYHRPETTTLQSMPLESLLSAAYATLRPAPDELAPPSSRRRDALAPSSRRDSIVPSGRRDSMPPLRPISVAPGSLPALASTRSPPPSAQPPADSTRGGMLGSAAAALLLSAGLAIAKPLAPHTSYRGVHVDALWTTRVGKQVTGYAVVALVAVGLTLSLRKRWKRFTYGDVARLRVLHGALGAAALVCLACHTGLHLGERLNRLLSLDLLAASALGAVAAAASGLGDAAAGPAQRLFATRAHLYVLLPLPVLLVLHVLGAYYF
jgi:nitrite reductase (NADH) large subunit